MEKWKAKYAFHFPTPSTATRYLQKSMRYTNNPTGTKDRADHHFGDRYSVKDGPDEEQSEHAHTNLHRCALEIYIGK
jgi:hypothetical protein